MKILSGLLLLALSFHSIAADKVVYGDDNRLDIYESPNPVYKMLANSTAAMIASSFMRT